MPMPRRRPAATLALFMVAAGPPAPGIRRRGADGRARRPDSRSAWRASRPSHFAPNAQEPEF
jgi:hypothetical protein